MNSLDEIGGELTPWAYRLLLISGWDFTPRRNRAGRLVALVIFEPCPACQEVREIHFGSWSYSIPYGSSYIRPNDLHLCCDNNRAPIGCAASSEETGTTKTGSPVGLPVEVWLREFVPGGETLNLALFQHLEGAPSVT